MNIKNIVFDFGGVLIDWNPEHLYKHIFPDAEEMKYFLTTVCSMEWNGKQDGGRLFTEGIAELVDLYPHYRKEIEKYHSEWISMIGGEMIQNTGLLKGLKKNYRLFGLTNWSMETYPLVYERFNFFDYLEGIVISGEEKVIKPNQEIFDILLSRYSVLAEESLFIDDNQKNIEAAESLGFKVIHYHDSLNLQKELEGIGIKVL